MAQFQSTVRADQATGIIGEFAEGGPNRVFPGIINSTVATANIFGRVFTHVANSDDQVAAGGTGSFAGILVNPKQHALQGTTAGTLEPTLTLRNNENAEIADMGIIYVQIESAATIGQVIHYDTTSTATAGQMFAVNSGTAPAANRALLPNAKVVRNTTTAAGQAIIQLTN